MPGGPSVPAEEIGRQVDGDDDVGAERAADGNRHGIDHGAVYQPAPVEEHRLEDAGNGVGGADGIDQAAALHPHFVAGAQFGGDAHEARRQRLDARVLQLGFEQPRDLAAGEQAAAAKIDIEQAEDLASRQAAAKCLE
jgi:hypothetical protein